MILYIFLILLLSWYFKVFFLYRYSWKSIRPSKNINKTDFISVIVACRNEENNILNIIEDVKNQNFNKQRFEMIVVNDHSEDSTLLILEKAAKSWENLKIICMNDGEQGKKNAIKKGISCANGSVILCTDADCRAGKNWIKTIANYFTDKSVTLLSAPVEFHNEKGIFQKIQALEFLSLIGSGAAAINTGKGIFCNGANLAYRKSVFLEANSYDSNSTVSGDDVFLMHHVKVKYPSGIRFAKDREAIVKTDTQPNLKSFVNQRKRWTAKSSSYTDWDTISVSILVLLINVSIVLLSFLTILSELITHDSQLLMSSNWMLLIVLFFKYISDYNFLIPVLKFFRRRDLAIWILPFEVIYSFYIVSIVIYSFSSNFEWKGRKFRK
jgi:cellulose synthase/poly-beta-1,6-N-acetylglucosamine synthase-like glycosyltransferase